MAIDRSVFPKILHGGEEPASSWIPPGMLAHNPKLGLHFNPPEARRLLREAGYQDGRGFPRIVLGYDTEEDRKLVAEAVQGMWQRNLGIIVALENQEWKVYLKKLQTDPFPVFRDGWGADYPDPDNFMKLFVSHSGNNHLRWRNSRYDQLVEARRPRVGRQEARQALRRSAENSLRNRRPDGAALLAQRKYRFKSRLHRIGDELHGPFGSAVCAAGGTRKPTVISVDGFAMPSKIT